jgi:hypothetical protein
MKNKALRVFLLFISFLFIRLGINNNEVRSQNKIESPEQYFGFKPGSDKMLFDYETLIGYFKKLAPLSPKMRMLEIGKSPMGKEMYIIFISSENNIKNLDNLKEINRKLTLESNLSDSEKQILVKTGKVFVLSTLSMHSTEVGPSQASPEIVYKLITSGEPEILNWLNDVVLMLVPNHNPDGMDMVVNHYLKYKDTKYEGSSFPGVYHKYVGHDNNRDFVTLSQADNKNIARIYDKEWFPQVMVEKHQMGSGGPRYYVPPCHDPIAENIDAGIWNWSAVFGSNMIKDMTEKGLSGISQHYSFDDYWPGSTETCIWKNVIGLLTECASVNIATPIYIEPNELNAGGKGLSEYKKSTNMPLLWPGGWWKLKDIVEYEITSTFSIIKTAAANKEEILKFRNNLCQKEIMLGNTKPPYYYILPIEQHDKSELLNLIDLLEEHGISVYCLKSGVSINNQNFKAGDIVIPLSQPFRAFIKEIFEKQIYPLRHYTPGGEIIKPYDITSWSLPLHRGIKCIEINSTDLALPLDKLPSYIFPVTNKSNITRYFLFNINNNESFKAAFLSFKLGLKAERLETQYEYNGQSFGKGSFLIQKDDKDDSKNIGLLKEVKISPEFLVDKPKIELKPIKLPRIGIVETFFHDADAGWCRYVFDSYFIPFNIIHPGEFEKTDFENDYDIVIFPDADKSVLMNGKYKSEGSDQYTISNYPPEFTKGIGKEGMDRILNFLEKGGLIISWGKSTGLFMGNLELKMGKDKKEEFQLPIRDVSEQLQKSGLYCPGSLVKIILAENSPITLGLETEIGVFFRGSPVFSTVQPIFDMDRRVIGKFPESNILMSGYCENPEKISNKSALVWLKKGRGQMVLFGFNPQFRASTQASYKLIFNSLLLDKLKP